MTVFHVDVPILLAKESRILQVLAIAFFWHWEEKMTIILTYSQYGNKENSL